MLLNPDIVGKIVPQTSDIEHLAKGGQKLVFKARHEVYGDVVIKFIFDATDERIKREIEIVTEYTIKNVPELYEWQEAMVDGEQMLYMVEEFIDGTPLREIFKKHGKLPLGQCLEILESMLITVVELEKYRLVHRDIKPENIMLKKDGTVCLLDFGIARHLDKSSLTVTQARFGPHTPGYSAPEQFRNLKKEIDSRCDLFSIGVVVFEAIYGKHPFIDGSSDHPLDILQRTETISPPPLIIPGDTQKQLAGFINILMDKFPSRRPNSAKTALDWYYALLPTLKIEEVS